MAHPQGLTVASMPAEKAQARGSAARFPERKIHEPTPIAANASSPTTGYSQPEGVGLGSTA